MSHLFSLKCIGTANVIIRGFDIRGTENRGIPKITNKGKKKVLALFWLKLKVLVFADSKIPRDATCTLLGIKYKNSITETLFFAHLNLFYKYSQTFVQRPPLGPKNSGRC